LIPPENFEHGRPYTFSAVSTPRPVRPAEQDNERMNRPHRLLPAGVLLLSLPLLPGCADDVRTYEVPYVKQRLLGAFINTDEGLWAIKLMGRADEVATHKDEFEQFVKSIRLTGKGKQKPEWTAPTSWEYVPGSGMRYATFRLPKQLEVGIFYFEGGGGGLLRNVNRWRDQMKLDPISERGFMRDVTVVELAGGQKAYMLDVESARVAPLREENSGSGDDNPLTFTKPEGWVEQPKGQFAVLAFAIADGEQKARVTLTIAGGSLEANVNRWRGEVGLPDLDAAQVRQSLRDTTFNGDAAYQADLIGTQGKSTIGVIYPVGDRSLFVKMMGDSELVAKQKAKFEAFVGSLKVRGGN
jgi:hypothetical protein